MDKNELYDLQTMEIIWRTLGTNCTFVDVGCHEGRFTDAARVTAPQGRHVGFEPLPAFAAALKQRYTGTSVMIFAAALSDRAGVCPFVHLRDLAAYSGFRERDYPLPDPRREWIDVQAVRLDDVLPDLLVAMMKIDVEDAELQALRGSVGTIRRHRPVVVFELGLGAADRYGTTPDAIADCLEPCGLALYTLTGWLANETPTGRTGLADRYRDRSDCYFVGAPAD